MEIHQVPDALLVAPQMRSSVLPQESALEMQMKPVTSAFPNETSATKLHTNSAHQIPAAGLFAELPHRKWSTIFQKTPTNENPADLDRRN